jgi:hypothetical protein
MTRLPGPVGPDELRRLRETELAPALRALEADPGDAGAFESLLTAVAGHLIPGARWSRDGGLVGAAVSASGLFGDRAERSEALAGLVGATRPAGLLFCEIRLYRRSEHHDSSRPNAHRRHNVVHETDLFRGLFFAFDLGGSARGTTIVLPHRVGPAIADHDALDAVSVDDPAFARVFRVLSSDPDEARALLQPSTRAGLLRLREAAGHDVHLSLSDGRASVAIESGPPRLVPGGRVDDARVAEIAAAFALVDLASAALPVGVGLHVPGPAAPDAPGRPATSRTRLTRTTDGVTAEYTDGTSILLLALSALAAPFLAWGWIAAVRAWLAAPRSEIGPLAVMIPLAVATLLWLFAAQNWWAPVRRVEIRSGRIAIRRGYLRRTEAPAASVRAIEERAGVLYADRLALTPSLRGAELRWLAYELGRELPHAVREGGLPRERAATRRR